MSRTRIALLSIAVSAMFAGSASALDIAVNGGFETGDFSGWTIFPSGAGALTIVSPGAYGLSTFAADLNNTFPGSADLIKNANIGVGVVTANAPVTVEFDAKGNFGPGGVAFAELFSELAGGGVSKTQLLGGAPLHPDGVGIGINFDWTHFVFSTTTGSDVSGGLTVQFNSATGAFEGSTSELFVDNLRVTIADVPEPTGLGLVAGALPILARRRRA